MNRFQAARTATGWSLAPRLCDLEVSPPRS